MPTVYPIPCTVYRIITITFLMVFIGNISFAQVSVAAALDSSNMIIGDKFQLHLYVNHPQNASVQSVDLSGLKGVENLDIEAESAWDTTDNGGEITLQKDLTLQVWDSGYYWIPEIPFTIIENGSPGVFKTNSIPIAVSTVALPDSIQLADIKDILYEKANWQDYLPFMLLFVAIGLIISGYYWWKRHKKQKTGLPPPEIILPAHEIALTALSKLKEKKLWQQGQVKTYQSQLTHIIREYLENRYEIPALESTTDEILRHLKQEDFDDNWKGKLQNILQVADLVKFAKAKPPVDFHDKVWKEAEDFVITTKVKPIALEAIEVDSSNSNNKTIQQ